MCLLKTVAGLIHTPFLLTRAASEILKVRLRILLLPGTNKPKDLAQQNKQVIQQLLQTEPSQTSGSYDDQLLLKLRDFYSSCLNEDKLNEIGSEPLIHFVQTLRKLYSGNDTKVSFASEQDKKIHGLTAATAFLHSRGTLI